MQTHLICSIQGGRFAFDVGLISEVVRMPWVTPIAETPPDVRGVVNYHGTFIAVVDPALRLSGERSQTGVDGYLVILDLKHDHVAFVVDRVEDLTQAPYTPAPKDTAPPGFVLGHLDDGHGLATVVDVDSLMRADVREFVARARDSAPPA